MRKRRMVLIQLWFSRCCTSEQGSECDDLEKPSHKVTISRSFIRKSRSDTGFIHVMTGKNPSDQTVEEIVQ